MSSTPYDPDWTPEDDDGAPELDPDFDGEEVSPEEEEIFQHDMESLVQHYQDEQDEFNGEAEEFIATYGFVHDCRCAQDWEEGNLGVVSMCYLGMVTDAMNTLADKITSLKEVERENAKLRIQLADASN